MDTKTFGIVSPSMPIFAIGSDGNGNAFIRASIGNEFDLRQMSNLLSKYELLELINHCQAILDESK